MNIGIDATNIRGGGGLTHLTELLAAANPDIDCFKQVHVWCNKATAEALPSRPWLFTHDTGQADRAGISLIFWLRRRLPIELRNHDCDILFVPGGLSFCTFRPLVSMSQNLLPFEENESRRYGLTFTRLRFLTLKILQSSTFKKSDGLIFISEYARNTITNVIGPLKCRTIVIKHGIPERFKLAPRPQQDASFFSEQRPVTILYVSSISVYKHQRKVIEALARLRCRGTPLALQLVGGPGQQRQLSLLKECIAKFDPTNNWISYIGPVSYSSLDTFYHNADIGLFASSCENLPITLLEKMASGLPLACSNRGPMPEVLKDGGIYFDPENADEIESSVHLLIQSKTTRINVAASAYTESKFYTWDKCARETFHYIRSVFARYQGR
jgi:glycosyltransferase involved in cell wall biosynthesis